jgi:hypothetical protein
VTLRISDRGTFRDWLQSQPEEVARVLAHRTAARILPIMARDVVHGDFHDTWRAGLAKYILRCTLAARLVCVAPNAPRVTVAAAAAAATATTGYAATAAAAAIAAAAAATATTATAATAAAAAATTAAAYVWNPLSVDARLIEGGMRPEDLLSAPLWQKAQMPQALRAHWQNLQQSLLRDDENWQFWIDFYDGIVKGGTYRPAQIDLFDQIAQMPNDVWDRPSSEVNAQIAVYHEAFVRREFMRPETMVLDKETVQFSIQDDVEVDPDFLGRCVKMIHDREAERSRRGNQMPFDDRLTAIVERWERAAEASPISPLDLYDESKQLIIDVSEYLARPDVESNDLIERYLKDANKVADLIYNSDEKVQQMDALMSDKTVDLPAKDSPEAAALIGAIEAGIELSIGPLKVDLEINLDRLLRMFGHKISAHLIRPWQYRLSARLLELRAMAMDARELILPKLNAENFQQATDILKATQDTSEPWLFVPGIAYLIYNFFSKGGK